MDAQGQSKIFDVSRPSTIAPSATSKPIIVGHQPMMPDPMVTANRPAPLQAMASHTSKVIPVSPEVQQQMSEPPAVLPPKPDLSQSDAPPAPSTLSPSPPAAQIPSEAPVASAASTLVMASPPAMATAAQPHADLAQLPHVPVSHMPVGSSGRLGHMLIWVVALGLLILFGLYIAIDAGLIASSLSLPVHIFNR